MSLFDGKPLTEEEIAARDLCLCDHARAFHTSEPQKIEGFTHAGCGGSLIVIGCAICDECEEFTPAEVSA